MAYSKQNFQDGQILNAANLEAMENGIIAGQGAKNLLVNSDFRNPIDIDNKIGTTNVDPCFTRWNMQRASSNTTTQIIKIDNGIRVYKKGGVARFYQSCNYNLLGKTVSYAIGTTEGIFVGSCSVGTSSVFTRIGTHTGYLSVYHSSESGKTIFSLYFNDNSEDAIDLYWAALYEGAYTKETLPNYVPNGKYIEMINCGIPTSPRNVLKNSDFTNPLNTNGFSSMSSGAYITIDCWNSWISGNGGKIELTSSGIKLSPPSSENIGIYQQIENYQLNKIYTVVVYINDLPYLKSFQMGNFGVGTKLGPIYFYSIPSANVLIRINSTDSAVTIQKVALYEGAYTLDTIPMYQSESKHVEMLNCGIPLAPHNILDNSDFTNPVNQRGATTTSQYKYFLDRWISRLSDISLAVGNSGLTLTSSATANIFIYQKLSAGKALNGKTVTVAVCDGTGNVATTTTNLPTTNATSWTSYAVAQTNNGVYASVIDLGSGDYPIAVRVGVQSDALNKTIRWAALYEGAYDASTLPAYQPKGYAAELAECQRYYENSWFGVGKTATQEYFANVWSSTQADARIEFKQQKRISPTITFYPIGTDSNWKIFNNGYQFVDSIENRGRGGLSGFIARVTKGSSDGTTWTLGYTIQAQGHWEASADL